MNKFGGLNFAKNANSKERNAAARPKAAFFYATLTKAVRTYNFYLERESNKL